MIETILALIGGIKGLIVGGIGLLGGLWALWQRRTINKQRATLDRQDRAISTYKAKEEVHKQDQTLDSQIDRRFEELRDKVDSSPSQEAAANELKKGFDEYFSKGDKK